MLRPFRGFVIGIPVAVALVRLDPLSDIAPWETWFDELGLFWGMSMLAAFTWFILLVVPLILAGSLNELSLRTGSVTAFFATFLGLLLSYAVRGGGPDLAWYAPTCALAALLCLTSYAAGFGLKTIAKRWVPNTVKLT
jgi:hypothetical protein